MTFVETMEQMLGAHGLWEDEAKEVIRLVREKDEIMKDRWECQVEEFPYQVKWIVWSACRQEAIKYLLENKPKHFAIGILECSR